jgi:hypothetical protein
MDISIYLKELDEIIKNTKNARLAEYIAYYRSFVHEMVTVNVVLNKAFYIVVPFSSLEGGVGAVAQGMQKGQSQAQTMATNAKKALQSKVDSLLGQLQKFAMSARVLEREDLIKLFYDLYNEGLGLEVEQTVPGIDATMVTGGNQP